MKSLNLLLSIVIILLIATSFESKESEKSEGFIGQVIYSMMPPTVFTADNPDWILMDGRDVEGSEFHRQTGLTKIPDAQNQFIRGMGGKFDEADGYKDGNERTVGSRQEYSTGTPKDEFLYSKREDIVPYEDKDNDCYILTYSGASELISENPTYHILELGESRSKIQDIGCWNSLTEVLNGDPETRPTNIALYTYIKIND